MAKKTGRPLADINPETVEGMASVGATDHEIADFCGVDRSTISKRFSLILVKARSDMRIKLRRAQMKLAESGNATMQIWLGKQMLGQTDQQEVQHTGEATIILKHASAHE